MVGLEEWFEALWKKIVNIVIAVGSKSDKMDWLRYELTKRTAVLLDFVQMRVGGSALSKFYGIFGANLVRR